VKFCFSRWIRFTSRRRSPAIVDFFSPDYGRPVGWAEPSCFRGGERSQIVHRASCLGIVGSSSKYRCSSNKNESCSGIRKHLEYTYRYDSKESTNCRYRDVRTTAICSIHAPRFIGRRTGRSFIGPRSVRVADFFTMWIEILFTRHTFLFHQILLLVFSSSREDGKTRKNRIT
jgi:hypothetical protein